MLQKVKNVKVEAQFPPIAIIHFVQFMWLYDFLLR